MHINNAQASECPFFLSPGYQLLNVEMGKFMKHRKVVLVLAGCYS